MIKRILPRTTRKTRNKNFKIFRFLFVWLVWFAVINSCKTVQEPVVVVEPEPVQEPAPVRRSTVVFKTTNDPSTGYDWEIWIDYASTGRFALNNLQKEDVYPGAKNSPQKLTYTLRSTQPGRVFVHFIYRRPMGGPFGGGGAQEAGRCVYTFDIEQDLTINLINTERTVKHGYTEDSMPVIEEPEIKN